jgi:DNA mismatch endonuclease (patch repair protein)
MPKSREEFWQLKLTGNRERDLRIRSQLETAGWTVLEIWECETTKPERLAELIETVRSFAIPKPPSTSRTESL